MEASWLSDPNYWAQFPFEKVTLSDADKWLKAFTDEECCAFTEGFFAKHVEYGDVLALMREVGEALAQAALSAAFMHARINHAVLLILRRGVRAHLEKHGCTSGTLINKNTEGE